LAHALQAKAAPTGQQAINAETGRAPQPTQPTYAPIQSNVGLPEVPR